MKLEQDTQELQIALDAVVRKTMEMDLTWDWPCGVAYYGVAQAFTLTQNKEYLALLKNRIDEHLALGMPAVTVNTCAMGHCLLTLWEATNDDKYRDVVEEKVEYLRSKALHFGDNVLQHTVSENNDFPEQAWADTLFMAAFFLLRYGVKMKDEAIIADALHNYYWHIKYLQDNDTGLWYHGYNNITQDHMSAMYWGRANAWAAYTMAQVKKQLPQPYLYPIYMDVDCALRDQLSALKVLQTENGLWRTVLNDAESYEELSASAGIAAAMLLNNNPLHTKHARLATQGILANITQDGKLLNVSGGTAVMHDLDGYRNISRDWMQGWGQGLALAFLCVALKSE